MTNREKALKLVLAAEAILAAGKLQPMEAAVKKAIKLTRMEPGDGNIAFYIVPKAAKYKPLEDQLPGIGWGPTDGWWLEDPNFEGGGGGPTFANSPAFKVYRKVDSFIRKTLNKASPQDVAKVLPQAEALLCELADAHLQLMTQGSGYWKPDAKTLVDNLKKALKPHLKLTKFSEYGPGFLYLELKDPKYNALEDERPGLSLGDDLGVGSGDLDFEWFLDAPGLEGGGPSASNIPNKVLQAQAQLEKLLRKIATPEDTVKAISVMEKALAHLADLMLKAN